MEDRPGLSNMDFISPRPMWLQPLLRGQYETNTESSIWRHSPEWSSATWWWADYVRLLPSWDVQCFVLTRVDLSLDTDLPFLHTYLPELTFMDSTKIPYPPSWYSTQHCFWSKNSLRGTWGATMGSGIHRPYNAPHHPEADGCKNCEMAFWRLITLLQVFLPSLVMNIFVCV